METKVNGERHCFTLEFGKLEDKGMSQRDPKASKTKS